MMKNMAQIGDTIWVDRDWIIDLAFSGTNADGLTTFSTRYRSGEKVEWRSKWPAERIIMSIGLPCSTL